MRLLAILALLAAIYYFAMRPKTTPEATPATPPASPTPAQSTNAIKQPIDRAKDALDAAKRRSQEEF